MLRKLGIFATAVALIAVAFIWLNPSKAAPNIDLAMTNGQKAQLQDYAGQPVLLAFWSVGCPVCIKEVSLLNQFQASHPNTKLIGVSASYDPPPATLKAIQLLKPEYDITFDVHGDISRAFDGIRATPSFFLISADQKVIYSHIGPFEYEKVSKLVTPTS